MLKIHGAPCVRHPLRAVPASSVRTPLAPRPVPTTRRTLGVPCARKKKKNKRGASPSDNGAEDADALPEEDTTAAAADASAPSGPSSEAVAEVEVEEEPAEVRAEDPVAEIAEEVTFTFDGDGPTSEESEAAVEAEEETPAAQEETPVVEEEAPKAEEETPVVEEETPKAETETPVVEEAEEAQMEEEETPVAEVANSEAAVAMAEAVSGVPDSADGGEADQGVQKRAALKLKLLEKIAGLDRGAIASRFQKQDVADAIWALEAVNPTPAPLTVGTPPPADGQWELLYSSVEQFRSSPFFWAFQAGVVGDVELANNVFKFTDRVPGAKVGSAVQNISLATRQLVSEVDLEVGENPFVPGLFGTVVTTSSLVVTGPRTADVTVESTRVTNSNTLPFLEAITVPVKELVDQVLGSGRTTAEFEITYMDDELRVSRTTYDNAVFVYRRV